MIKISRAKLTELSLDLEVAAANLTDSNGLKIGILHATPGELETAVLFALSFLASTAYKRAEFVMPGDVQEISLSK